MDDRTIWGKAGTMTRTVPTFLRAVPAHDAAQVRAGRRYGEYVTIFVFVRGHVLVVHLYKLTLARCEAFDSFFSLLQTIPD